MIQLFLMKKQWISLFFIIDLNDPDPHLELDIQDRKVKQGLGNITMNKPRGDDGIPAELFQIWKDYVKVLLKCCTQYGSKSGKLSRGHQTGKDQFSFQSQRKVMPKKV